MTTLERFIDVAPYPATRPRFGQGRTYKDGKYSAYLDELRLRLAGMGRVSGALRVVVEFHFTVPASASKKQHADALDRWDVVPTKYDIDNLLKAVLDAANGVLWVDDRHVAEVATRKQYSSRAGIRLRVEEIDHERWCDGVPSLEDELDSGRVR